MTQQKRNEMKGKQGAEKRNKSRLRRVQRTNRVNFFVFGQTDCTGREYRYKTFDTITGNL